VRAPIVALAATITAATIATLGGCDEGGGSYGVPKGAPLHVVATSLDRYRPSTKAGEEARGVPLHPLFVVRFDRLLAPSSDYRPNFTIASGAFGNVTFREIRVDPVAREVVFAIADDLLPHTRYVLHVESAPDPSTRLAAVDGVPLASAVDVPFWTEDAKAPGEVAENDLNPDAQPTDACDVAALFAKTCAGNNCHGSASEAPAMGLNLGTSAGIQATAVGKVAVQAAYEATPGGAGQPSSLAFPYGLPLIRPGQSSTSFLLYKILKRAPDDGTPADASAFALAGAPVGSATRADLAAVPGSGMPHDTLVPNPDQQQNPRLPLGWGDARLVRRWIDAGAPACVR
jgi:hypothetical protein